MHLILNNFLNNVLIGKHYRSYNIATRAKVAFFNVISPIGVGLLVFLSIDNTYNKLKPLDELIVDWFFAFLLVVSYLTFLVFKKEKFYSHFLGISQVIYMSFMFYTGGVNGTAYLWFFLIVMNLFFFNDFLSGVVYVGSLLLAIVVISLIFDMYEVYPPDHLFRFYLVFSIFALVMAVFQLSSRRLFAAYQLQAEEMKLKNEKLNSVIQEQRKLTTELAEKEKENAQILKDLEVIINNTDDLIWYIDRKGEITKYNKAFEERLKWRFNVSMENEGVKKFKNEEFSPEWVEKWKERLKGVFRGSSPYKISFTDQGLNEGKPFYFKSDLFPVVSEGEVIGVACFGRDITKQRLSEKLKLEAIVQSVDNERRRIASDLHDGLGQTLIAANLLFQSMENLEDGSEERAKARKDVLNLLDLAIDESRNTAHQLMPQSLDEFGLIPSVKSLINRFTSNNISISFNHTVSADFRFTTQIENNLYRVVQESLSNIIKHSKASKVEIQLVVHDKSIIFTVCDDGIGFAGNGNSSAGLGLKNIKNRVASMEGDVVVDTAPGRGTNLTIEIPYSNG